MSFQQIILWCVRNDQKRLKARLISENSTEKCDEIFKEYEQKKITKKVYVAEILKEFGNLDFEFCTKFLNWQEICFF